MWVLLLLALVRVFWVVLGNGFIGCHRLLLVRDRIGTSWDLRARRTVAGLTSSSAAIPAELAPAR
ncbi:MAG: hypothetical protein BGP03_32675 [Pseudonocardia sp. 73-21]|nr:MAG: hypothetical protein BGP03_32675 [Pseudonocardia sp. 73-21]